MTVLAWVIWALLALWIVPGAVLCMRAHTWPLGIAWWLWLPSLVLPPVLVPVALWWAIWRTPGMRPAMLTPWWSWLQTPDCDLPGDTTIPAVADVLARDGWFACSWYWLGWRNTAQGLAAAFGCSVAAPWPPEVGYYSSPDGLWWERRSIMGGRLQLKRGWRTYPDGHGGWLAVPCLTITKP